MTWTSTAVKELEELGWSSRSAAAVVVKGRKRWKVLISAPICHPGKETKLKSQVSTCDLWDSNWQRPQISFSIT